MWGVVGWTRIRAIRDMSMRTLRVCPSSLIGEKYPFMGDMTGVGPTEFGDMSFYWGPRYVGVPKSIIGGQNSSGLIVGHVATFRLQIPPGSGVAHAASQVGVMLFSNVTLT